MSRELKESRRETLIPIEVIEDMNAHLPNNLTMKDIQQIKYGQPFKFYYLLNSDLFHVDIDELELSVRSYNSLKRAGFQSIGHLVKEIDGEDDLKKLRNCGKKSILEIMTKLFVYQYSSLPPEQREWYMNKIVEINEIVEQ